VFRIAFRRVVNIAACGAFILVHENLFGNVLIEFGSLHIIINHNAFVNLRFNSAHRIIQDDREPVIRKIPK
jgi:hypothetical protein